MTTTIGILGGGISGLSTAFYLARRLGSNSNVRITLLEKSKRLGGWIKSDTVTVHPGGQAHQVVLEAGPRSLRPKSLEMLELIHILGLEPALTLVPYSHPAARNRFVYYPETGITRLPSNILTLLASQIVDRASLGGLLPAAMTEPFRAANRPTHLMDESFDEFISRRFGEDFARRFGSSLVHGIYATDSRKLSMRAAFGPIWAAESAGAGSVVRGLLRGSEPTEHPDGYEPGRMLDIMKGVSVYKFRNGLESISRALGMALQSDPRVEIRTGEDVRSLRLSDRGEGVIVETSSGSTTFSHLVSTLPLPVLSRTLPSTHSLPHLNFNPYTTVHVVNIVFPPSPTPLHPPGFGYLVPRPQTDYASSGDPVLGCVFDSTVSSDSRPTVLTTMLGGPFSIDPEPLPLNKILPILARHLGLISLPEPIFHRYHIQSNCIPTLLVGHLDRMAELKDALRSKWKERLHVIGSGVGGVSLGDCVRDGRAAAFRLVDALGRAS